MNTLTRWIVALTALSASALWAQDITGAWQGTLHLAAGKDLRTVVKISKAETGSLKAIFYSIDQGGQGFPASAITLQNATLKFAIAAIGGTYEGKLANTDATSITGFWSQGGPPIALDLTLANDQTAWAIPELPPPPAPMAADASPQFEVATIKPTDPGVQGRGIGLRGR